jgi:hypothetical protein
MHAVIAPTYVHGHIFLVNGEGETKEFGKSCMLVRGNES